MMQFFCISHIHAYAPFLFYHLVLCCDGAFLLVSLSLSLSRIVCAWHPSASLLCPRTLFIPRHLLPLILLLFMLGSVMRRPVRTSQRTSPNMAFIRNATWFYRTFLILLFPLSFTSRNGNLYVRYPWVVPPWSYRSFTPTCTDSIILYLVSSLLFELYIS